MALKNNNKEENATVKSQRTCNALSAIYFVEMMNI